MSVRAAVVLALLAITPAAGKVVSATDAGMVVESEATIAASPTKVWATLVAPARWWSSKHSWSGDAANFRLDPRAGGCFCEVLPGGGSVEHLRVVFAQPGKLLRLYGGLGPFQGDAAAGPLTWTLAADGAGTKVTVRYAVAGVARAPFQVMAPIVDGVLGEQLGGLKAAAEAR